MTRQSNGALFLALGLAACASPAHESPAEYAAAQAASKQDVVRLMKAFEPVRLRQAGACPTTQDTCQDEIEIKPKDGGCGVSAHFDPLQVNKGGTVVQWIITDHRFKFASNGIDLDPQAPYTQSHRVDDWTWEAKANNGHPHVVHHYNINVVDAHNQACGVDPVIVSDW